jgi:hypothetical protein
MNTRAYGIDLASRAQRRRLVVLMAASYLVTFAVVFSWGKALAMFGLAFSALPYIAIVRFTRHYTLRSSPYEPARPDERQARVRDHAMGRAYLVLGTLTMLASAFSVFIAEPEWWSVHRHTVLPMLFFGVNFLVLSLPEAIIAWNEPDTLT